jgi:hypothetical protein
MHLYLIKSSKHDLVNVVRERSKCIDDANAAAYKEMIRDFRFMLGKRDTFSKLKPNLDGEN